VYVTDWGPPFKVQKFDSNGMYIMSFGSGTQGTGDGQFDAVYGVAVDASGYVYITDYSNNRIQKFGDCSGVPTNTPSPTSTDTPYVSPTITPTNGDNEDVSGDDSYAAPQPGKDTIKIVFNVKQDANVKIYFYNFAGKFIGTEEKYCTTGINKMQVDTSKLPPGIYYYIIHAKYNNGNEKYRSKKFYIMR
jgi:hypothetical protein